MTEGRRAKERGRGSSEKREKENGDWGEMGREVGRQREGDRVRQRQTTMKRGSNGAGEMLGKLI